MSAQIKDGGAVDVLAAVVTIQPTQYGKFFVTDSDGRVWRGDDWVTFGPAELYSDYAAAMTARRSALARAGGAK